jgi:Cd2+/Zn2+-exporting ATPase
VPIRAATDVFGGPRKGRRGPHRRAAFWLGSHRFLEERGQETPEVHERLEAMARSGQTIVVVGNETTSAASSRWPTRVRPESSAAVAALKRAGVTRVVMLTGDNRGTAEVVGREVGVDEVRAELLPEDKVRAWRSWSGTTVPPR